MIPEVEEYLKKKFGENYQGDAQKKYDETVDQNNTASLFANLGDVIGKRSVGSADAYFNDLNQQAKADTLGKVEKEKQNFATDYDLSRKMTNDKASDEQRVRDMDLNSEESKMARSLAVSMGIPEAKAAGLTAARFKELSPVLSKKYEIEQNRLNRIDAREQRNSEREAKANEKRETKELELAVPGYSRTGEVMPKTEEAAKFRKATAVSKQLSLKLNQMKDLVDKYGSYESGGKGGTEMESLATEIQLLGKSPELYELGVLAGPDLTLLEKITSNPSSWGSMFTRDGSRLQQIDSQLKSLDQKLGTTAESLGYKKSGGVEADTAVVRVRDPRGVVRTIPKAMLNQAINAGGIPVDNVAGK